jgi:K+-sensing histidine kinase KdpD
MSGLLPFSARPDPSNSEFDLGELVLEIGESLELRGGVFLDIDIPPYTMLRGNRSEIGRLLERLISNAFQVTPRGGSVVITAARDAAGIELEIADSDAAFAAPSESADADTGAWPFLPGGWADLQQILADHGGGIEVTECPDGGTAFTLRFPHTSGGEPRTRRAA